MDSMKITGLEFYPGVGFSQGSSLGRDFTKNLINISLKVEVKAKLVPMRSAEAHCGVAFSIILTAGTSWGTVRFLPLPTSNELRILTEQEDGWVPESRLDAWERR